MSDKTTVPVVVGLHVCVGMILIVCCCSILDLGKLHR